MEKTGKKKPAGGWLHQQFLGRIATAGMLFNGRRGMCVGVHGARIARVRRSGGHARVVGGNGRDGSGARPLLRVLPQGRCILEGGAGSGAADWRLHRPCRGAARLRGRTRREGGAGRTGQRRPCRDDAGRHLGGGDEVGLAEQEAVCFSAGPSEEERAPGPKPSGDVPPGAWCPGDCRQRPRLVRVAGLLCTSTYSRRYRSAKSATVGGGASASIGSPALMHAMSRAASLRVWPGETSP